MAQGIDTRRQAPWRRIAYGLLACLLLSGLAVAHAHAGPPERIRYLSPLGIAVDARGTTAFVALHTAGAVAIVDLTRGRVTDLIPVGQGPHDLIVNQGKIYVTCESDDKLVRIDASRRAVDREWRVGQAPRGLAADPTGSRLYVACRDEEALAVVDVATGRALSWQQIGRPDRVTITKAGHVAVACATGDQSLVAFQTGDLRTEVVPKWAFLSGASNLHGLAPFGNGMLVMHQRPRSNIPATQVAQGWVFTNALTWLRPEDLAEPRVLQSRVRRIILDQPNRGYPDPAEVVVHGN
jgi:hypothetical protein